MFTSDQIRQAVKLIVEEGYSDKDFVKSLTPDQIQKLDFQLMDSNLIEAILDKCSVTLLTAKQLQDGVQC